MSLELGAAAILGGSSVANSALGYIAQRNANKTNKSIANANNALSIELANTAHQREVEDLKTAGLNPVLSAGGNGADTPTLQQPDIKSQYDPYAASDLLKTLSEVSLNKATEQKVNQETITEEARTIVTQAEAKLKEINADIASKTKPEVIETKKKELDEMLWKIHTLQEQATNTRINSTTALKNYEYIDAQMSAELKNLVANTKYTNERSRGHSMSFSGNSSVGLQGFSSGNSASTTY